MNNVLLFVALGNGKLNRFSQIGSILTENAFLERIFLCFEIVEHGICHCVHHDI